MLLETKANPRAIELKLIKAVAPDFLGIFFLMAGILNAIVLILNFIPFPEVILVVFGICAMSFVVAFSRFYEYLATILRGMGALSYIYEDLGSEEALIKVDVPRPVVIVSEFLDNDFKDSDARMYIFRMNTKSEKYKSKCLIVAGKSGYSFDVDVVDWRDQRHVRAAKGSIYRLETAAVSLINDIRTEVLESKGVPIKLVGVEGAYKPMPVIQKTAVRVAPGEIKEVPLKLTTHEEIEERKAEEKKPEKKEAMQWVPTGRAPVEVVEGPAEKGGLAAEKVRAAPETPTEELKVPGKAAARGGPIAAPAKESRIITSLPWQAPAPRRETTVSVALPGGTGGIGGIKTVRGPGLALGGGGAAKPGGFGAIHARKQPTAGHEDLQMPELKPVDLKDLEKQETEIRAKLKTRKITAKEKKVLLDALYMVEEIERFIKDN